MIRITFLWRRRVVGRLSERGSMEVETREGSFYERVCDGEDGRR